MVCLALISTLPGESATDTYTSYDDQAAFITYTGSWNQAGSGFPKAWNTSDHWTNVQNAAATLSFTADGSITYVYTMHNNRGSAKVYIDNVQKDEVNLYVDPNTPTAWQMAKTYAVSAGQHTIKVQNTGTNYIDVDRLIVDTLKASTGTYDNNDAAFNYFGSWLSGNFSTAYGGTDTWTNTPESGVTFTFVGDTVTYVYTKHPNRGKAKIYIDGINYADVDLSLPANLPAQWQQSTTYTGLSSTNNGGIHTMHISVGGAGQAGGTYIDVDAIIVGYSSTGIGSPTGCETAHYYYCTTVSYISLPSGGRRILQRWYGGATAATFGSNINSWRLNFIRVVP